MHYCKLLLIKAENNDDALDKASKFINLICETEEADWWVIWGRWDGKIPNNVGLLKDNIDVVKDAINESAKRNEENMDKIKEDLIELASKTANLEIRDFSMLSYRMKLAENYEYGYFWEQQVVYIPYDNFDDVGCSQSIPAELETLEWYYVVVIDIHN